MDRGNTREVWLQLDGIDFRLIEELGFLERGRGYSFPSRGYLASKLKVSIGTISRHTSKLRSLGLLKVVHRSYRAARGRIKSRSNLYQVLSCVGAKVRGILSRLTGVRPNARIPKPKEEVIVPNFSFVKNKEVRAYLTRFSDRGTAVNKP